jgi:hypothetical protein
MIFRDRGFDDVAIIAATLVFLCIDPGDKLDPVEIGEAIDTPRGYGLRSCLSSQS